ncbi:MAG: hypothetical protein ACTTHM_07220 [Peptoanaerobacter stomatis]|uniref:hypothetical protein n=1 Tax=Peptoanaerobacter stomatis TaxID=796937 RepID=UPI003FA127F7
MIKFNEKLNARKDKQPYYIEELIEIKNNKYEGFLAHDNITIDTINVYSGSKLTGEKINSYVISIDDELPWKVYISINTNLSTVYVSYETIGDTVEAEDINELQSAINEIYVNIDKKVQSIIDSAPEALDTLKELAGALNNDSNFATTITNKLAEKLSKQEAQEIYVTKAEANSNNKPLTWGQLKGGS